MMTSNVPAVRAGWPKLAIRLIKGLPPISSESILQRIGGLRAQVRAAAFRDWMSLDAFIQIADATMVVLGLSETRVLWRNVMLEALRQPAVRELVRRAGDTSASPIPLFERTQDAFNFVHRGCGSWVVQPAQGVNTVVVTLQDAPAASLKSLGLQAVYWANLSAVLVELGIEGRVAMTTDTTASSLRYTARW